MRTLALSLTLTLVAAATVVLYQQTETVPPQPPVVARVEAAMKQQMRRGWLRVVMDGPILEIRVNGEAVMGYTGRAPRLEDVDTAAIRGIAKKAVDLYAPPRYGAPPGVDSVRVRLRHAYLLGPIVYRTAKKSFTYSTSQLGR
jgi:hypothetical protein